MKYGPADVFLFIDGYNGILWDVQNLEYEQEAMTGEVSGLGTSFRRHAPTGISQAAVTLDGSVFDDGSKDSVAALNQLTTGPGATDRIISLGLMKTSIGSQCEGFQGAIQGSYKVVTSLEDLQRISATFEISGSRDPGLVLLDLTTLTSDSNSRSSSLDNGSSSDLGLVGYLHVNSFDGSTGDQLLVTIQESSDDSTYADILTFTCTSSTGDPFVDRAATTGSIERYLAAAWAFTDSGLGNADAFVMAARL